MKHTVKRLPCGWLRAAAVLLTLTLLLVGCAKDPKQDPSNQTTAAATTASTDPAATADPIGSAGTETAAPPETESPLPAPDFNRTFWRACFGDVLETGYYLELHPDGTLRHIGAGSGELGTEGSYSYENGILKINFLQVRKELRWDGSSFAAAQQTGQAGSDLRTISPAPEAAEYFAGSIDPNWTPALNRTDISFFGVGESFTLSVGEVPAGVTVVWSAENEEIASVDETGRVKAVGPGSARIFAEIGDKKLACWVRCQFEAPAGEEEPALNRTDISFFGVGERFTLSVSNLPEDVKPVWSSEDVYVATVDENGLVTAVGPGTIRVAAQAGDKTLYCWVRCQFTIPAPRSSVSDGTWMVNLSKDRVTPDGEGGFSAEADLLDHVFVTKNELDRFQSGSALDLTEFGLKVYRVREVTYNEADASYLVAVDGGSDMTFTKDNRGRWCLMTADGDFALWVSGSAKLIFSSSASYYREKTGTQDGGASPVGGLMDFFTMTDYFSSVPTVSVTVSDGLVTSATLCCAP